MLRRIFLVLTGLAAALAVWVGLGLPPRLGIAIAIPGPEPGTVLIPPDALAAGPAVWVVEKEAVYRRLITPGPVTARGTEIRRGLLPGQAVVLDPPADLRDGQPIRLRP